MLLLGYKTVERLSHYVQYFIFHSLNSSPGTKEILGSMANAHDTLYIRMLNKNIRGIKQCKASD